MEGDGESLEGWSGVKASPRCYWIIKPQELRGPLGYPEEHACTGGQSGNWLYVVWPGGLCGWGS